jgi:hypothetical protein
MLVSWLLHLDPMVPAHYVGVLCAIGALSALLPLPGRKHAERDSALTRDATAARLPA